MREKSIEELVLEFQQGDEEAFLEIYDRFHKHIFSIGMKVCRSKADADDIVQETFLQVRKSISTLQSPAYFPLWIGRIANNKCIDLFKRNKAKGFELAPENLIDNIVEVKMEHNPKSASHHSTDMYILKELILTLPEKQQEVINLMYFDQKSLAEIAVITNISVNTVKSRMRIARASLKQQIERYESKEHTKLDFNVDAVLPQLGYAYMASLLVKSPSTFFTTAGAKAIMIAGIATLTTITTAATVYHVQKASQDLAFNSIQVDGSYINTPQDAYFYLAKFALTEEQLKTKTKEELLTVKPIYEELKKSDSVYYKTIQKNAWESNFNRLLDN